MNRTTKMKSPILLINNKRRAYRDSTIMSSVDERDERYKTDEHVDIFLGGAERVGHPGAGEQAAEVPAVLARRDERVAPPQRAPELLERPPRGLPPHQLRELELPQQAADDLHVLRQPPARVAVPPARPARPWTPRSRPAPARSTGRSSRPAAP
jgi:hypothetical protein